MRTARLTTLAGAALLTVVLVSPTPAQTVTAAACDGLTAQRLPNTTITTAQAVTSGSFTPVRSSPGKAPRTV